MKTKHHPLFPTIIALAAALNLPVRAESWPPLKDFVSNGVLVIKARQAGEFPPKNASSNAAITFAAGGLPIILSAPHGGRAAIPGVPERKGDGASRFNPRPDSNTVGIHGSSSGGTIDAIQLELGTKYRDSKTIEDVADKLANAITAFAKSHLSAEEQKPVASDASKRTGKIAVGVYLDKGAGPSVNDLLRALSRFDQVTGNGRGNRCDHLIDSKCHSVAAACESGQRA